MIFFVGARTGTIPLIMVEWDTGGTSSRSFFCIALAILAQKNQVDVRGKLEKPTKEMYTLGPGLRTLHIKNLGIDLALERLRTCPCRTAETTYQMHPHSMKLRYTSSPSGSRGQRLATCCVRGHTLTSPSAASCAAPSQPYTLPFGHTPLAVARAPSSLRLAT